MVVPAEMTAHVLVEVCARQSAAALALVPQDVRAQAHAPASLRAAAVLAAARPVDVILDVAASKEEREV